MSIIDQADQGGGCIWGIIACAGRPLQLPQVGDLAVQLLQLVTEADDIQAPGRAMELVQASDELVAVDGSVVVEVEELEEALDLVPLHLDAQLADCCPHGRVVQQGLEGLCVQEPLLIGNGSGKELLHLVEPMLARLQVLQESLALSFERNLVGVLHKNSCNNIQHNEKHKGHVECEGQAQQRVDLHQGFGHISPVYAAEHTLVQGEDGSQEGVILVQGGAPNVPREDGDAVQDDDGEEEHKATQQAECPRKGLQGVHDAGDHDAEVTEKSQHPYHSQDTGEAQDPQDSPDRDVLGCPEEVCEDEHLLCQGYGNDERIESIPPDQGIGYGEEARSIRQDPEDEFNNEDRGEDEFESAQPRALPSMDNGMVCLQPDHNDVAEDEN
mmetsp:Transcript_17479/g.38309  ORF Transcript_17479/g.38309 Transcript_17479/m.38309 type:complete len:384 (+) Transcript_17479:104-1255(+)